MCTILAVNAENGKVNLFLELKDRRTEYISMLEEDINTGTHIITMDSLNIMFNMASELNLLTNFVYV